MFADLREWQQDAAATRSFVDHFPNSTEHEAWMMFLLEACPCEAVDIMGKCDGFTPFEHPRKHGVRIQPQNHSQTRTLIKKNCTSLKALRELFKERPLFQSVHQRLRELPSDSPKASVAKIWDFCASPTPPPTPAKPSDSPGTNASDRSQSPPVHQRPRLCPNCRYIFTLARDPAGLEQVPALYEVLMFDESGKQIQIQDEVDALPDNVMVEPAQNGSIQVRITEEEDLECIHSLVSTIEDATAIGIEAMELSED
jgi:hypothetical protein